MKKPSSTDAGKAETAGRRRRVVAAAIGVSALLALGGVAWASGQGGAARASDTQGDAGNAASTPSGAAANAATPSSVPGPPVAAPESAPAPPAPAVPAAPPAAGTADPGPVDRNGKSDEELATIPQPTAAPVEIKAKKVVKGGVSATITEMTAVQGVATGIGEVAGPSVRFKVTVVNDTAKAISLDAAVVDLSYGKDDEPAGQLSGPDAVPFPASVEPGTSAAGVFVFSVPPDARDKVKIHFNLEAETPVATFEGKVP